MKKTTAIIIALVVAIAAFAGGFAIAKISKNDGGTQGSNSNNVGAQNNDGTDKNENENSDSENLEEASVTYKNIFFSPHTGSDETGDGSQYSPVMTLEKAEEIAEATQVGENEKLLILEYVMTVNVKTEAAAGVSSSVGGINMIPFTGSCDSYYFKGEMPIKGCDTQKYAPDGSVMFSARYILKGTDFDGKQCSIFIENNGPALELCTPTVITDSAALSDLQTAKLRAIVVPVGGGVDVNMYKIIEK